MSKFKKLYINDNQFLAYNKFVPSNSNGNVGVIFLSGFMSDMEGSKAVFLEGLCKKLTVSFVRFDYSGCGASSGDFIDGTISKWKEDTLKIIDDFTEVEKIILVGSSMGGWLMLLAALERKDKVKSLLGIASASDFTEDLMWRALTEEAQNEIMNNGLYNLPTDYCDDPNSDEQNFYPITKDLIESGRANMLLNRNVIDLNIPIILIHGIKDEDVPYEYSIDIKEKLSSSDVKVILSKDGKHRMSEPEDLNLIEESLKQLL